MSTTNPTDIVYVTVISSAWFLLLYWGSWKAAPYLSKQNPPVTLPLLVLTWTCITFPALVVWVKAKAVVGGVQTSTSWFNVGWSSNLNFFNISEQAEPQEEQPAVPDEPPPVRRRHSMVPVDPRLPNFAIWPDFFGQLAQQNFPPSPQRQRRASESDIDCLRTYPHPAEVELTCSICLDDAKEGDEMKALPCEHAFHSRCIAQWMRKNVTCPCCRVTAC